MPRRGRAGWIGIAVLAAVASLGWAESGTFEVAGGGGPVRFDYWIPQRSSPAPMRVLVLVPGYNGSGRDLLTADWTGFAEREGVVLLAPTFRTSPGELARGAGYYYPGQGSGIALERALEELGRVAAVDSGRVLLFGFSAGAHFAHRFAAWRPGRVRAFVAGGAAWWDEPSAALAGVPAFVFCGEADPRLEACQRYYEAGAARDFPWVWRSYRGTGHTVSPAMRRAAQAFLAHYARTNRGEEAWFGDAQTYEVSRERETIPEAVRVRLPGAAFAEIWRREE